MGLFKRNSNQKPSHPEFQCPKCGMPFSGRPEKCQNCGLIFTWDTYDQKNPPTPEPSEIKTNDSKKKTSSGGFTDIFHVSKIKEENERLHELMTPEMQDSINMQNHLDSLSKQISDLEKQISKKQTELSNLEKKSEEMISKRESTLQNIDKEIHQKKSSLIVLDEEILVQEFGLYKPIYDFAKSDDYKNRLNAIRDQQKDMIKKGTAATGNMGWTVNGNAAKGKKMVTDMQKLLLRAFNSECDELINKVKYNNFDTYKKRICSSRDAISKLGVMMGISVSPGYLKLKLDELHLAFEYQQKKQEEKEALKEARAEMREAAKLQKEIEAQRKKVEKEQAHYKNALLQVLKQLEDSEVPSQELLDKKAELETQLGEIDLTIKDLDYREANQRAGYVYVISNIGAFGENIYKIGMTRRLNPQERVDELGDASVPFNFDVHAMIFSDDAPALENALHKAFEDRKLNMVNQRREFFHVTLDEIKDVVRKNYDKTVEFIDIPDAEQFRESEKMRNNKGC